MLFCLKQTAAPTGQADDSSSRRWRWQVALSGFCLGYAAITNYVPAIVVPVFGAYLIWGRHGANHLKWFALGVAVPLVLLGAYNLSCFGALLATNYQHMNIYLSGGHPVDAHMLVLPRWDVAGTVLFSPFRGLFFSAPVLLLGVYGLWHLFRNTPWKPEAAVGAFICVLYLLFNASFWGWHAGWTVVPRYLGPAVPFLAAPMVFGLIRFPKTGLTLAVVSVIINLLFTAVDPQVPTEFASVDNVAAWPQWRHAPLFEYTVPMFFTGRAAPILDRQLESMMNDYAAELDAHKIGEPQKDRVLAVMRERLKTAARTRMTPLSGGPISGNPAGIYEGSYYMLFPPRTRQAEWNSFNAGEFLFPQNRLSLLPLLLVCGGLLVASFRSCSP